MAIRIATQIIKESISNNIFNNIIDIIDFRKMWEKLYTTCSQIGQKIIYSILQELLNCPYVNKPKEFEKSVESVFTNICFLVKWLRLAITPNQDIWDSIVIVIILNLLYNNFETTTNNMLKSGNKTIDKIQQILASAKAKFISKWATRVTKDLAMLSQRMIGKRKATSNNRYFNCNKLKHFGRNCR